MTKENKLPLRKIILLSSIVILAAIYILQLAFTGRSKIKTLSTEAEITRIEISSDSSSFEVVKENENWVVGSNRYAASGDKVNELVSALKEIKLLGTSTNNASSDEERYGLNQGTAIVAKAYAQDGKVVRQITVGKNTATNSQSYIKVEDKPQVYLAQGPLHSTFAKTVADLRDKKVFKIDSSAVVSVQVENAEGSFVVAKNMPSLNGQEVSSLWTLAENSTGTSGSLDDEKVTNFVNGILSCDASEWLEDDAALSGTVTSTVSVSTSTHTYTVSINDDEESPSARASESPYTFTMSKYSAGRFQKKLSDLIK